MEATSLDLEPDWNSLEADGTINFLAELVIWDPSHNKHLVKSCLYGRYIVVEGHLPKAAAYTFFGCGCDSGWFSNQGANWQNNICHASCYPRQWLLHQHCGDFFGIGDHVKWSYRIRVLQSKRRTNCDQFSFNINRGGAIDNWLKVIWGTNEVLYKLWKAHPKSAFLTAGFSCQPWSKLGDGKGNEGWTSHGTPFSGWGRLFSFVHPEFWWSVSQGLERILKFVHWSNNGVKARDSRHPISHCSLSDVWPAKRDRWWCIVTSSLLPRVPIVPWPKVEPLPTVASVLPVFPQMEWWTHSRYQTWFVWNQQVHWIWVPSWMYCQVEWTYADRAPMDGVSSSRARVAVVSGRWVMRGWKAKVCMELW